MFDAVLVLRCENREQRVCEGVQARYFFCGDAVPWRNEMSMALSKVTSLGLKIQAFHRPGLNFLSSATNVLT